MARPLPDNGYALLCLLPRFCTSSKTVLFIFSYLLRVRPQGNACLNVLYLNYLV